MLKVLTVLVAALLVTGCLRTQSLKPGENSVWIGVKNASYEKVWKAANTVMARHLDITETNAETGRIDGIDSKDGKPRNEAVAIFVWPMEDSDVGYGVDVDFLLLQPFLRGNVVDWRKVIIDDFKKELGKS
jgi:hypothetical protein